MNNFKSLFNLSTQLLNNAIHSNVLLSQLRFRPRYPINRGAPRPLPYGVTRPEPNKYNWIPIYPPDGKYTTMPLKIQKLGGRDPVTGRVVVKTIGGGNKKYFRWIDYSREANPDGTPKEEKVYQIRYDPLRTTKLALIAGGDKVRWIMATEKMQVGDVIRTYSDIPRNPVRPREADAHPVGALPIGTKVHNVQILPGHEKTTIRHAGSYTELVRRVGRRNYLVENQGGREMCIDQTCMVTVGRLSNPYHDQVNKMCAQRTRWLGKRPKSGAFHKKDGYCGRKPKVPKPVRDHFATAIAAQKSGKTLNNLSDTSSEVYKLEPF